MDAQFESFRAQLDESSTLRGRIRAVVSKVESASCVASAALLLVHQPVLLSDVLGKAKAQVEVIKGLYSQLVEILKECPGQYYRYHADRRSETQALVSMLAFITNLQALDCASFLGAKLQKMNVSMNVYSSCQITLKDFSLQVGSQVCVLPSMPSDASFDPASGIRFTCDLNDNIAAPWPSSLQASSSSCNKFEPSSCDIGALARDQRPPHACRGPGEARIELRGVWPGC